MHSLKTEVVKEPINNSKMKLTRAEEELMQIIWDLGPCTVSQVREVIAEQNNNKKPPHSTISTIVRILEEKGYLNHKVYGRTYEYRPIISRKEYSKTSLKKLVNDYFNGSMDTLVSFMVKEDDLKISELSDLVERLEDED